MFAGNPVYRKSFSYLAYIESYYTGFINNFYQNQWELCEIFVFNG